jgi:hypothetical protein
MHRGPRCKSTLALAYHRGRHRLSCAAHAVVIVLLLLGLATMIEAWFGLGKKSPREDAGDGGQAEKTQVVGCLSASGAKTLGSGRVTEYRLAMPYALHEAEKAKKFSVAKMSEDEDDGGGNRAVELVYKENSLHPLLGLRGVHTKKLYHIGQRLPAWVRMLLPGLNFDLEEEAWTLGPHGEITLVHLTMPMLAQFAINMRTVNLLGTPAVDDAHQLGAEVRKRRDVVDLKTSGSVMVAYKLVPRSCLFLGCLRLNGH